SMDILDWDISGIKDLGVTVKTNMCVGIDTTIAGLLGQGFDAVFAATGGWDSRMARNQADRPVPVFPGTHLLIDLVRSSRDSSIHVDCGTQAVIAGGGRYLADAVQTLVAKGVKKITIVSRSPENDPDVDLSALEPAEKDAVTLICNAGITKVMGENDTLVAVEATDLVSGERLHIAADTLIIGAGRFPELVFVPSLSSKTHMEDPDAADQTTAADTSLAWEGVELPKKPDIHSQKGLLSDQDIISEYPAAVSAINGGRKAAAAMHNLMYGLPFQDPAKMVTPQTRLQDVSTLVQVKTTPQHVFDMDVRKTARTGEPLGKQGTADAASTGFSEKNARDEAKRCLQCGLICYEKTRES
ncbi:MAG: electron transporter RnfB, partial [Desulfobacteraceae bacterium]|nr:electron transporter RnfB [Desulfobacteraceae bacterium]